MSDTRGTLRTRLINRLDAVGSARWDVTAGAAGELDQLGGTVHWREWRRLLNANRNLRMGSRTVTSDSTGRYAVSGLNSGAADSLQTFYRVLSFQVDNVPYQMDSFEKWSAAEALGLAPNVWWREGDNLMALPKQPLKAATIWVNHLPARLDLLAADGSSVVFPDGYEELLVTEWAILALIKGDAESGAIQGFKALAEELRQDMLSDLARTSTQPLRMEYSDSASDWGS